MDWAVWLTQLEAFWHSPAFPMWATLVGAAFFAIVLLVTLLRADRSVANGALAIITLLAIGVAGAATVRHNVATGGGTDSSGPVLGQGALACLDGLSGDRVEAACEKALFGSAESTAAAVSYTAAQISRLPVAAGQATPELAMLRRVLERDRYGLAAQVLMTREGCTPSGTCEAFRYLVNTSQIVANMNGGAFNTLVARYEESWGEQPAALASVRGKPTDIEYPTSASIPPVSIMTPEPSRSEPATQASAPPRSEPAPAAPPMMAMPSNLVPFPSGAPSTPPAQQTKRAPASSPPAPAKRAAAPGPTPLVPQ
jgi:hypothetical protein